MNKFNKILATLFISTTILLTNTSVVGAFAYQKTDFSVITNGLTQTTQRRLLSNGKWLNFSYIAMDLKNQNLYVDVLSADEGLAYLKNTKAIAETNDALAAVNGDFFAWKKNTSGSGTAVGTIIRDNVLLSNPSKEKGMGTMMIGKNGSVDFDILSMNITITAANGKKDTVSTINKWSDLSKIAMFTKEFGSPTPASSREILVVDNIVKEVRYTRKPFTSIPENGYVLAVLDDWNTFIIDNFREGDKVSLSTTSTPSIDNVKTAIGGGGILVKDGVVPNSFTHNIAGVTARSAVGVNKDKTKLYLVTVDGLQAISTGLTQRDFADYLVGLGIYSAINLDGGGSTTLVAKSLTNNVMNVINYPSGGAMRAVSNALGIKTTAKATGNASNIVISSYLPNVFVGDSIQLGLLGKDKYGFPANIIEDDVEFSVSGVKGKFDGKTFYPTSVGTATITAKCGDATGSYVVNVLENPKFLEFSSRVISTKKSQSTKLYIVARDKNGKGAILNNKNISISSSKNIAGYKNNSLTATADGSAILTATYGKMTANTLIKSGTGAVNLTIPVNKSEKDIFDKTGENTEFNGFSFKIMGNPKAVGTLLDSSANGKAASLVKSAGVSAFVGKNTSASLVGNGANTLSSSSNKYFNKTANNSAFAAVNTNSGTISSSIQLANLASTLNAKYENDIFVVTSTNVDEITNTNDRTMIIDMLNKAASKGKRVYYIYSTNTANGASLVRDGVRYIGIPNLSPDLSINDIKNGIYKPNLVSFNIDSKGIVNYRFE